MPSRDQNLQKERLLTAWLALAATSTKILKHAAMMDKLEGNGMQFGTAIEFNYLPEDSQREHPIGMTTLAVQAFEWIEGRAKAPEWVRHAGIVE